METALLIFDYKQHNSDDKIESLTVSRVGVVMTVRDQHVFQRVAFAVRGIVAEINVLWECSVKICDEK